MEWFLFSFQLNLLDVGETLAVEPFHKWMAKIFLSAAITEEEATPFSSASQLQRDVATGLFPFSIRDGALQVQELTWPTGSMDDPIDVGTAKVARGLMTCILFEVRAQELWRMTCQYSTWHEWTWLNLIWVKLRYIILHVMNWLNRFKLTYQICVTWHNVTSTVTWRHRLTRLYRWKCVTWQNGILIWLDMLWHGVTD